jgi:hypothetical protein
LRISVIITVILAQLLVRLGQISAKFGFGFVIGFALGPLFPDSWFEWLYAWGAAQTSTSHAMGNVI